MIPKGTNSEYMFSTGTTDLRQNFILHTVHGIPEKPPYFDSGSAHVRTFRNVSRQQRLLPANLCACYRDSENLSNITGVMAHFKCYKRPGAAHARSFFRDIFTILLGFEK